jgi:ankyrin repeat protein
LHVAAHCCGYTFKKKHRASEEKDEADDENEEKSQEATCEQQLANSEQIEILRLLCKSGARVNSKDSKSLTALHYACRVNNKVGDILAYFSIKTRIIFANR